MQAGKLRHPITIQSSSTTRNTNGETVPIWQDVANRRASVEPLSGREMWQARQIDASVTHRVTLRADAALNITPKMRVLFNGRIFDINFADKPDEITRKYNLFCTEAV